MKHMATWEFIVAFAGGWFIRGLSPMQGLVVNGVLLVGLIVLHVLDKRLKKKLAKRYAEAQAETQTHTPKSKITVKQMLLIDQISNHQNVTAMIELWEDIYGQPCDPTRTLTDIAAEVTVVLTEMSS